ncbi:DUF4956 domain-containing protein [Bythopirellula polymerisocia]|uniref:DUF4956 domain-containing protein n=1 Tax=Bythopirellula polymerisocia TaxID=2528003 RepID=A0A5C6CW27_9BACT|nr:DUF4956 domain-containing protein [Bythopirellula polymerisocia]TWU27737.1 hypothetical protein Pla144_25140 [Bythopirellula polymerisocia]
MNTDITLLTESEMGMELFEVPIFDDDVFKLLFRYLVNFVVVMIIVRFIYYKNTNSKDYLFTFFMINTLVFFICFTLKKFDLGLGMALGLFAIFGILRYRTSTIPIKEMTYLFMVIGVGVINSLANKKMSYAELAITNLCIIGLSAALENISLFKREVRETILYEKVDLIRPEKHADLVADLQERTGLKLSRLELGEINFLRDTVSIDLFYYPHEQAPPREDCIEVTMRTQRE